MIPGPIIGTRVRRRYEDLYVIVKKLLDSISSIHVSVGNSNILIQGFPSVTLSVCMTCPHSYIGWTSLQYINLYGGRDSSFGIGNRLWAGRSMGLGSISGKGKRLFSITPRLTLWPIQPLTKWVQRAVAPGIKVTSMQCQV
jgi:hypothetical protein